MLLDPLSRTAIVPAVPEKGAEAEVDAMDIDEGDEVVPAGGSDTEDDPAAMQLEMEMRGPPRGEGQEEEKKAAPRETAPPPRVSSGGFTAINGR